MDNGFLPPPGLRLYVLPSARCRSGISSFTAAQNASDIVHDLQLFFSIFPTAFGGHFTTSAYLRIGSKSSGTVYLDELRVTTGSLSSISPYDPADAPYDTNKVLALPDSLVANTIYVQSSTTVNGYRVGGVRPSNPSNGFFYVPLYSDYTAAQPQMYVNGNWVSVSAVVYGDTSTKDVLGFKFSPPGASPDVNPDLDQAPLISRR